MKNTGFSGRKSTIHEIWWISWHNPADFMVKSSRFHAKDFASDEKYSIQW